MFLGVVKVETGVVLLDRPLRRWLKEMSDVAPSGLGNGKGMQLDPFSHLLGLLHRTKPCLEFIHVPSHKGNTGKELSQYWFVSAAAMHESNDILNTFEL